MEELTPSQVSAKHVDKEVAVRGFVTSLNMPYVTLKSGVVLYKCEICDSEIKLIIGKQLAPPKRCEQCKKLSLVKEGEEKSEYLDAQEGTLCSLPFYLEGDLVGSVYQESHCILYGTVRLKTEIIRGKRVLFLDVQRVDMKEKRVKLIDDLPEDIIAEIDAYDAGTKVPHKRVNIPEKIRKKVLERDGYKCKSCGVSWMDTSLEIDHIIPVASGAENVNDISNLQVLCRRCNSMKRASLPSGFAGVRGMEKKDKKQKSLDVEETESPD